MKKIIWLLIAIKLFAITKEDIYNLYKHEDYKNTCIRGVWILDKYKKDDDYMSIVSLSCVKMDMINTAIRISKYMNHTPIGRENASYIVSLFLIKKLLLQLVWDGIDISNLSLPKSDHILSIVFENIAHNNYSKVANQYIVKENNYRYVLSKKGSNKISIKTYKDDVFIKEHLYW